MNLRDGKNGWLNALELKALETGLNEHRRTEHFVLHYTPRNPLSGPGHSQHGVYGTALVEAYGEALEAAYRVLQAAPWQRQPPLTNPAHQRTDVFICEVPEPFVTVWRGQYPVLALPSGRTLLDDHERVLAEAAHEVMHLFNFRERPFMAINGDWQAVLESARWKWLDEGMALCLEGAVFEQNVDRYRFLRAWVNQPEVPLDDKRAIYQTGMFLSYLYRRFGVALVNEVWLSAVEEGRRETPFAAFDRVLQAQHTSFAEVFADYCRAAFFLRDPASHCYEPEIEARFGERALTESFVLRAGDQSEVTSQLDHLACRYFRCTLAGAAGLRVCVQMAEALPLRAEWAWLTPNGTRGASHRLTAGQEHHLPASTAAEQGILIVSNCGTQAEQENLRLPHDDAIPFTLTITAV